jgi:hypothetical protein
MSSAVRLGSQSRLQLLTSGGIASVVRADDAVGNAPVNCSKSSGSTVCPFDRANLAGDATVSQCLAPSSNLAENVRPLHADILQDCTGSSGVRSSYRFGLSAGSPEVTGETHPLLVLAVDRARAAQLPRCRWRSESVYRGCVGRGSRSRAPDELLPQQPLGPKRKKPRDRSEDRRGASCSERWVRGSACPRVLAQRVVAGEPNVAPVDRDCVDLAEQVNLFCNHRLTQQTQGRVLERSETALALEVHADAGCCRRSNTDPPRRSKTDPPGRG